MIYFNGKEITPKLNGVNLSRVMYNGKQVYPEIITLDNVTNGVWAVDNNEIFHPVSNYNGDISDIKGCYYKSDKCEFYITKGTDDIKTNVIWSSILYGTNVPEIHNMTRGTIDDNCYDGYNDSSVIRSLTPGEDNAANYCYSKQIIFGGRQYNGYQLSIGEVNELTINEEYSNFNYNNNFGKSFRYGLSMYLYTNEVTLDSDDNYYVAIGNPQYYIAKDSIYTVMLGMNLSTLVFPAYKLK